MGVEKCVIFSSPEDGFVGSFSFPGWVAKNARICVYVYVFVTADRERSG